MSVKIGSKYVDNLSRIKHHIASINSGCFHEETEITFFPLSGRCYYNLCYNKEVPADTALAISTDKHTEIYLFHAECIESLLQNPIFQIRN